MLNNILSSFKKANLILIISLLFIFGCLSKGDIPEISFYYWKTTFNLSEYEKQILKENKVKNLFIKYFDVDLNTESQKAFPLSPIVFEQKIKDFRVIPVVYIKNKVMLQENADMKELAGKILNFIQQINKKQAIDIDEIQVDCDWTIKSRDNYFQFIKYLKTAGKIKISATIRLHQVKYYLKTGIPGVDRGVLMYYNMGNIGQDSSNSIYEKSFADKYLNSLGKYPLELDLALPIYSWGIQIRENKVLNLINKLNVSSFENDTNFVPQGNHTFMVKNSTIKLGYYFKVNDRIKIELISFSDLKEMAIDLSRNLKKNPKEIIFYDLDSTNLKTYKNENQAFKKIVNYF